MAWPESGGRQVALADEGALPLPDGCIDRILIVHGLEFSEQRRAMLEEVWRVMKPNGRILVLVPNRHGLWARAEATPFGHGSQFSASQLGRLLREHRFAPVASGAMLFLPPSGWRAVLRTAAVWQRLGRHLGRPLRRPRLRGSRQDRVRGPPGDGAAKASGHHAAAATGAGRRANGRRRLRLTGGRPKAGTPPARRTSWRSAPVPVNRRTRPRESTWVRRSIRMPSSRQSMTKSLIVQGLICGVSYQSSPEPKATGIRPRVSRCSRLRQCPKLGIETMRSGRS